MTKTKTKTKAEAEEEEEEILLDSVMMVPKDYNLLPIMFDMYGAPEPMVDVTYGMGRFWEKNDYFPMGLDIGAGMSEWRTNKKTKEREWVLISDAGIRADYRQLPIQSSSVGTLIFDPPHVARPSNENSTSIYGMYNIEVFDNRFDHFLAEAVRVLQPGGLLITKLSNEISRDNWHVADFLHDAKEAGLIRFDEVIKYRHRSIYNPAQKKHRAIHRHSTFIICKKKGRLRKNGQKTLS